MPERVLPSCFDPYLRYAIAMEFKYFKSFHVQDRRLFLLAEFKTAGQADNFANDMIEAGFLVEVGPAADSIRYATLRTGPEAVVNAVAGSIAFRLWERYVSRVELSLPVKPTNTEPVFREALLDRSKDGGPRGPLLIGVIDDGCPLAAAQFLKPASGGGANTRVLGIWDQNDRDSIMVTDGGGNPQRFGEELLDFDYGLEFRRDSSASQIGLDDWIKRHTSTLTGSIDDDGCYADAGFETLKRRQSHGAHVMDVLAGRIPTSSRIGPSQDRRDPPSWLPGTDAASKADVVFVQFSEDCVRDATGVWLKAYVVDGIRYILSFADPKKTKNVIINVSYGPTTGPHDGTAALEDALTALVTEFDGSPGKPKLEIFLPAGNSFLSEGHVVFKGSGKQPTDAKWVWHLPPDNTALCFAEIWMETNDANNVTVTLTSPSGATSTSATGPIAPPIGVPLPPYTGVYAPLVWGNDTMWLLAVEPTIARSGLVPEHGDWTIEVDGIGANVEVHAYVARSDPNMGVRTGARRSYFVDPKWEQNRSAEASCAYIDGEFDKRGSLIHRYGTLNGIATADVSGVHVAGGYMLANGRKSPYSSAGPARDGSRRGPDYALPCDESYALQGIRAGGNRSGSVFRLAGTSAAAPQLARWVSSAATLVATDPSQPEKRGKGNLRPP